MDGSSEFQRNVSYPLVSAQNTQEGIRIIDRWEKSQRRKIPKTFLPVRASEDSWLLNMFRKERGRDEQGEWYAQVAKYLSMPKHGYEVTATREAKWAGMGALSPVFWWDDGTQQWWAGAWSSWADDSARALACSLSVLFYCFKALKRG